jgi:predicted enzyme related to lactoylglutathione lyase
MLWATQHPLTENAMAHDIRYAELHSQDPRRAGAFYAELFGWKTDTKATPMGDYTEIDTGDGIGAGLMRSPFAGGASYWTPYVTVPRLDAAVERATALGAKLEAPRATVPDVGHFAILRDPSGAVFGLFETLAR